MNKLILLFSISFLLLYSCESNKTEDLNTTKITSSKIIKSNKAICPESHPFEAGGICWVDAEQARSSGLDVEGDDDTGTENENEPDNDSEKDNTDTENDPNTDPNQISTCGEFTYNPNNIKCIKNVGNDNAGCLNSDGLFVSQKNVVSNPCNTKEAVLDIERNLGIDIDDQFIELCGYQGTVPSINPTISKGDFVIYMKKLFIGVDEDGKNGDQYAIEFANLLDTNNDGILTRNEASQAKGSDPRQILNLEPIFSLNGGLATDDLLAYVGLYLGDGALDKYAGDLPQMIQDNMAAFTRTWQPGVDATSMRYSHNPDDE